MYADFVIIGAGAAGIGAARELRSLGRDFLLLEASHRIGGRAHTEYMAPGLPFDLGAHWIMAPSINPLMSITTPQDLALDRQPAQYAAARYFEDDHWLPDDTYKTVGAHWDTQFATMQRAMAVDKAQSVYDAVDNESRWAPYFRMFFAQDITHDIDQACLEDTLAFESVGEDIAVASGLGSLLARFAADVPVQLNSAVTRIDSTAAGVRLHTSRGEIRTRKVILTVSTGVLATRQIKFEPELPDWKYQAVENLPLGSCTRVALQFDSPSLQELPTEFTVTADGDEPLHFRNRPCGHDYIEVAAGGRIGAWLEKLGERRTIDFILTKLRHVAGNQAVPEPMRRIVSAWDGDAWIKGSYSCARPGAHHRREMLRAPLDDRVFFAGEATSSKYFASVHGAYLSGRDAARASAGLG